MKIKFLVDNRSGHAGLEKEHGLSIYLEADGRKILFDAGASDACIRNAEAMGVDLRAVDLAVVSHGHYDHTGGFPAFCRINEEAPIFIHKNAFRDSYGYTSDGSRKKDPSGIRWTQSQKEAMRSRFILTEGPVAITENIVITGTVPLSKGFHPTETFYYLNEDHAETEDDLSHEQCLVIREGDGISIFSGCCHRGVISALEAGMKMFPGEAVKLFVAGMHLYSTSEKNREHVIQQVVDQVLIEQRIRKLMPVHCTGEAAIQKLEQALGTQCIAAKTGDEFDEC